MVRFIFALILSLAAWPALAADAIRFGYTPSSSAYVRIFTSSSASIAAAMTEGTSGAVGRYAVSEATLVSGGLSTAGVYDYKIFAGGTPSTTANDTHLASGVLYWTGAASLTPENYLLLTVTSDTGSTTIGRALHQLRQAWVGSTPVFTEAALANAPAGGGGGVTIPVNQVRVADSRTWVLKPTATGLQSELKRTLTLGNAKPFAVDFRNDLSTNGQLIDVESIIVVDDDGAEVEGETGVTFADTATDPGVDRTQAKFTITGAEAGTYRIRVTVEVDDSDGGGTSSGTVTLIVAP